MLIALLSTLIVLCAVLLISFLLERRKCLRMQQRLFRESRKLERTSHIAGAILKNVHAFILLIDNDFKVLKTNYYQKTGTRKGTEEKRVGDLLHCLLYTSDAADEEDSVDLGGRRIIKKKKRKKNAGV